jgi:transposase InsO family protein
VRYGYRRVHVLLRREGWIINMKKTRRIYNELGLQLRNKHPKRRVKAKLREDRQEAVEPNDVWAMDFVHDHLATGKKLRILTIVDTHSRLCPATDPRFTYRGEDVVQTLESVCSRIGYPKTIRVIMAANSSRAISTYGPTPTTSRSTSHGLASLLTMASSSVQQQVPGGMSERPLVPDPCGCPRKDGGLA